jgi:hypothetical protein
MGYSVAQHSGDARVGIEHQVAPLQSARADDAHGQAADSNGRIRQDGLLGAAIA